jgi:hypothetical protein
MSVKVWVGQTDGSGLEENASGCASAGGRLKTAAYSGEIPGTSRCGSVSEPFALPIPIQPWASYRFSP